MQACAKMLARNPSNPVPQTVGVQDFRIQGFQDSRNKVGVQDLIRNKVGVQDFRISGFKDSRIPGIPGIKWVSRICRNKVGVQDLPGFFQTCGAGMQACAKMLAGIKWVSSIYYLLSEDG
jgi:hypothetical protein